MSLSFETEADADTGIGAILAKLSVVVQKSTDMQAAAMQRAAASAKQPVYFREIQTAVVNASGIAVLDHTGPDQGQIWYVRQIVVGGLTTTTATPGRADVFVDALDMSGPSMSSLAIGLSAWRDQSLTLPNIAFYGAGEMQLTSPEELTVVVSNATVGQSVVSVVRGVSFATAANKQEWGM